jgi:16S rRNA processing protein RimM
MDDRASRAGEFLIVGRIRRPHGIRGECVIAVDTDRPDAVLRNGRVLTLGNPVGAESGQEVTIERIRETPSGAIVRFTGFDSREAAEEVRGATLLIAASEAQPAGADEVHYRDLVGMTAFDQGLEIGTVDDILELATGEMLVIRSSDGEKEILVPFVRQMVRDIDVESKRLGLDLPPGLLEL